MINLPYKFRKNCQTVVIVLALQSCISTSRLDSIVKDYYNESKVGISFATPNEKIQIINDSVVQYDTHSKTKSIATVFLPLFFYTFSHQKLSCTINPIIYENIIIHALNKHLEDTTVAKKLTQKNLEIVSSPKNWTRGN